MSFRGMIGVLLDDLASGFAFVSLLPLSGVEKIL